ncbi:MAG: prepilin peptidase [Candidatus Synoicihabitans palmerolidicus]|nr:prepilin peptidase [Candidatus Synoicihabitans palmerolidicus]
MGFDFALFNAEFPWFFATVATVFGAWVGSFLNVAIYRGPAGISVVHPGSHCACGSPIKWYDNLPILSWFILRGKARCCGQPYTIRYAAIEALTAVLFLACWLTRAPIPALGGMILLGLLIAATFIDLDHMIIPDGITIWGTVIAVALCFCFPSLHGYSREPIFILGSIHSGFTAMIGALIGSGVILWIGLLAETVLKKEAMGFGDVKFMGLIGAFLGWQGAVFTIFGGAIVGTIWFSIAMVVQLFTGEKNSAALRSEPPEGDETDIGFGAHVPFGPMLAIAATIYLLGASHFFESDIEHRAVPGDLVDQHHLEPYYSPPLFAGDAHHFRAVCRQQIQNFRPSTVFRVVRRRNFFGSLLIERGRR